MDIFQDVKAMDEKSAKEAGLITMIGDEIREKFVGRVLSCRKNPDVENDTAKEIKIVYTPFHGTGLVPVTEALDKAGYKLSLIHI